MGNGAIFKSVTKRDMAAVELVWPGIATAEQFSGVAEPMWNEIRLLTQSTVNARETRDLLLPRLVSGEVAVENLDIAIPELVA
jgi:type I restriction enzyme S subunit